MNFNILSIEDDDHKDEKNIPVISNLPSITRSVWADCNEEDDYDFIEVQKKTKRSGDKIQNTMCIGNIVFIHPRGWGKVQRQDDNSVLYTENVYGLKRGSRVRFVCSENHVGPCARNLEVV